MVDIAEKMMEARLRCYGHVIRRDEGELIRRDELCSTHDGDKIMCIVTQ